MSNPPKGFDPVFSSFGRQKNDKYTPPTFAVKQQKSLKKTGNFAIPDVWTDKKKTKNETLNIADSTPWVSGGGGSFQPKKDNAQSDNFDQLVKNKKEQSGISGELTEEQLVEMYSIMDQEDLEDDGYMVQKKICWEIVQPNGMTNKPAMKIFKEFKKACAKESAKVICSILFYHMVDTEAHFRTRLRAVFAAESLICEYEEFFNFFKQNEENLDVIDVEFMHGENKSAGKELSQLLGKIKTTLSQSFKGSNVQNEQPNLLDWQNDIQQDKKLTGNNEDLFALMGNSKKTQQINLSNHNAKSDLLDLGIESNPDPLGFLGKPTKSKQQNSGGDFDLLGGIVTQEKNSSNELDLLDISSPQGQVKQSSDIDLLGMSVPTPQKKDPFNFGI